MFTYATDKLKFLFEFPFVPYGGNWRRRSQDGRKHNIADYLKERYFLYVVRGFETPHPFFTVVRDPISSGLELKKHEIVSQQVSWFGNVTNDLISNCA